MSKTETRSSASLLNKSFVAFLNVLRFAILGQAIFNGLPSAAAAVANSAAFVKTDSTTQGNWKGVYGGDGYTVVNDTTNYPSYATVAPSGQNSYTWDAAPADTRALLKASSGRIAAAWYAANFQVDVNLTDGGTHQVALYMVDWDSTVRSQRIDVLDAGSGQLLNSQTLSNFNGGKYLAWNVSGHVVFKITLLAGGNAVLSGLFFGTTQANAPAITQNPSDASVSPGQTATFSVTATGSSLNYQWWSRPNAGSSFTKITAATSPSYVTPATSLTDSGKQFQVVVTNSVGTATSSIATLTVVTSVASSAAFLNVDTTTLGNWKGVYGSDGYAVVNDATNYPSYATVTPSGQNSYTWDGAPADTRALLRASSGRIAATWFAANFQVDVNLGSGGTHQAALYMVDWDSTIRTQRIDVLDSGSGLVLNSQTVSSFHGGKYLVWNVSGHVIFRISSLAGGNAVLSGLFFGLPDTAPPTVSLTAPAVNSTLTGTVIVSANASDNGFIRGVQFKVDGNNIGVEVPNWPYATVLDTTTLSNGTHTVSATARDGGNNTGFASSVVRVSNSATLNNPIKVENAKTGTSAWQLTAPAASGQIEGYASLTSVNIGGQIKLFVNTPDSHYTMDIYRMGWYNGAGAREVSGPITLSGMVQPAPTVDPATGLVECHWTNPYVLNVPSSWVSGVYLAKLTALTSGKQSYIVFDVRDDARPSDIVFQSSVTTYEAYNPWGGKSLYPYNSSSGVQAKKVSFNRPYGPGYGSAVAGVGAGHFLTTHAPLTYGVLGWEYNMVRWLERNGYDVTYLTDVDVHEQGTLLFNHRAFLSIGHDEYWSWAQRQNVENARDHGINLAFFAADVCYWQIRFEAGYDGQADRTIVGYKESALTADPYWLDSDPTNDKYVTSLWAQNNTKPREDALVGVAYFTDPVNADVVILDASSWIFQSTGLSNGSHLPGLLGYEVDRSFGNAPASLQVLASSPTPSGTNANMTLYTAASGAQVFATGSMQWSWGLDDDVFSPALRPSVLSPAAQTMTRNILNKFTQ